MRRFLFLTLVFLLSACATSGGSTAMPDTQIPVPPTATQPPSPTVTETPTAIATTTETPTPNPYESLTKINPSELTIESFLNAMPSDIKATHENPSAATQEQKDIHDKWISDAWKAIFNNLTDAQLSQMNLKRVDIGKLRLGPTGEMYTEVDGKQYPVFDYSLLRTIEAFSQEFNVYQAPFMVNLGEQIKVDPKNWIDFHRETIINPGETEGRIYGYGSGGINYDHKTLMDIRTIDNLNYFGKTISMNKAIIRFPFSGDLRLVFDYPGYSNSNIGLISMIDTDPARTERYALVLVNFGQGPTMHQVREERIDVTDHLEGVNIATNKPINIKTADQLVAIIKSSYEKNNLSPYVVRMGGPLGFSLVTDESIIPYTWVMEFFPDVQDPNLAIPTASVTMTPPSPPTPTPTPIPTVPAPTAVS
jgi:hypothetical protein